MRILRQNEALFRVTGKTSNVLFSLTMYCVLAAGVTGQQGMLTPPWHLISPLDFRGPCCPMLTDYVHVFVMFLTILTLVSLILVLLLLMHNKSGLLV